MKNGKELAKGRKQGNYTIGIRKTKTETERKYIEKRGKGDMKKRNNHRKKNETERGSEGKEKETERGGKRKRES